MRRADRLFQLVQFLRTRRMAVTARQIGQEFRISERTVYRDIQDLMDSGVPIVGEAGVGYLMDKSYHLPPMVFDMDELEAIALGIAMVKSWTDPEFSQRASRAMDKVLAALPVNLHDRMQQLTLYSEPSRSRIPWQVSFSGIRNSIHTRQKLRFDYTDEKGKTSQRNVRPLALVFFGPVWLLTAWCELRHDFRSFRLDRISNLEYCQAHFSDEPDKTLHCYMRRMTDCYPDGS